MKKIKIIYDGGCNFCVWLGQLTRKNSGENLDLMTWEELGDQEEFRHFLEGVDLDNLQSIAAIVDGRIHFGHEAWDLLVSHYPVMKSFYWLAEKIGLSKSLVDTAQKTAHGARFLCSACGYKARKNRIKD